MIFKNKIAAIYLLIIAIIIVGCSGEEISKGDEKYLETLSVYYKKVDEKAVVCDTSWEYVENSLESNDLFRIYDTADKMKILILQKAKEIRKVEIPKKLDKLTKKKLETFKDDLAFSYEMKAYSLTNIKKFVNEKNYEELQKAERDIKQSNELMISANVELMLLLQEANLTLDDLLGEGYFDDSNRVDISEENKSNIKSESNESNKSNEIIVNGDYLVYTLNNKSIIWDNTKKEDEASLRCNINNNDKEDEVRIGRDHPSGNIMLASIDSNYFYMLESPYIEDTYVEAFNEWELKEGYYLQATVYDLDNDNIGEIIISYGNKLTEMGIEIFKVTNNGSNPFKFVGYIEGQEFAIINENGEIEVPFGSQGLYSVYKLSSGKIMEIQQ